jgi:hypothetical protein
LWTVRALRDLYHMTYYGLKRILGCPWQRNVGLGHAPARKRRRAR